MWNSGNFEFSCIVGPALGGWLIDRYGVPLIYALDAACALVCLGFLLPIRAPQERAAEPAHPLQDLFSGIHFVRSSKVILPSSRSISSPCSSAAQAACCRFFADQILHTGAFGLAGCAPRRPSAQYSWRWCWRIVRRCGGPGGPCSAPVAGFGLATVVFASRKSSGCPWPPRLHRHLRHVSVVVRHTLVQLLTPDTMRGRVSAVNNIFIGSSNELGALESGLTAAAFGPVLSVVGGGIGTILVVLATAWKWPEVRRLGPLQPADPVGDREETTD